MKRFAINTSVAVILGLGIGLALLWLLGGGRAPAVAALHTEGHIETPSAPVDVLHVCFGGCLYSSIQDAVDAADAGDVIKVAAGTYTGVQDRTAPTGYEGPSIITQVVYISKTVTIRGGYTTANWSESHPISYPTTLDAREEGRVLFITDPSAGSGQAISPTIEGLRITGGNASGLGGHIDRWAYTGDAGSGVYIITAAVTIRDNQIFRNGYAGYGGGMYMLAAPADVRNNRIYSNTAMLGNGLYVKNSDAILSDNTITAHTLGFGGSGLYLELSNATLNGNTIAANTADRGGGVYIERSNATMNSNVITGNSAFCWSPRFCDVRGGSGGGLYLDNSAATLNQNVISGNTARDGSYFSKGLGGGLYLERSDAALDGNTLAANVASFGGGMYMDRSSATIVNSLVVDNWASGEGGGLYVEGASPRLWHTTLAHNGGSGVYATSYSDGQTITHSTVLLTNTILVSHTVGIIATAGNTATLEGTLWGAGAWANDIDWGGEGTILTGTVNLWGDPAFVDPTNGDYHIGLGSAAIDAGAYADVSTDIDGDPRPLGSGYDLGADEVGLVVTKQAYPDPVQPGAHLTYTIRITNVTSIDLHATITDTLPLSVTLDKTSGGTLALPGGTVVLPDGRVVVTWTAVLTTPDGVWMGTIVVTVDEGYSGPLSNLVEVTTEEGATGVYIETGIVLRPVYLPLILKKTSETTTVETVEGEYLSVGNPCTTDPCLPGMVYAVLADHTDYYLTVEGAWLWGNRAWDGYEPEIGDFVTVTGYVDKRTDIFGDPFYNIEVASLEPALPPPTTTENVAITDIQASGTGDQDPDEYVEIRNDGTQSVQLNGWTLHNAENHRVFTFPGYRMQPGQVCRVYTNEDHPEWCGFSFDSESDVWRYANGCAYLRDSVGTLVDAYCYCQAHTAYMILSATTTTLKVGDEVTATVTLLNRGCTSLGLPQYRLYVQSDEPEPIFDPSIPGPVTHYMGVAPGQSDGTEFTLQAIGPGQATFSASASFEVHLGYPGPAYWGYSSAGPLTVTVMP